MSRIFCGRRLSVTYIRQPTGCVGSSVTAALLTTNSPDKVPPELEEVIRNVAGLGYAGRFFNLFHGIDVDLITPRIAGSDTV